jgi:hypothetical protein
MQRGIAITVRYAGPTNSRGSRWIARADHPEGRAVVGYDHSLDTGLENAATAAQALVDRWNRDAQKRHPGDSLWVLLAGGHTVDGYAFIAGHQQPAR